jgi:hypothetical protein
MSEWTPLEDTQEVNLKYFQIIILLVIFSAQVLFSQSKIQKGFIATLGGGMSFPLNESAFKDNYDFGYHISGTGGYKINNTYIARSAIYYNNFPYIELNNVSGNLKIVVLNFEFLAGAFKTKQKYHPYGVIGAGIYFLNSDLTILGSPSSTNENYLGLSAGGGIVLDLSKSLGVFAEVQYCHNFNRGANKGFLPFKAGFSFAP